MHIIVCPDVQAQAQACASIIAAQVLRKPDCVLGLATGGSPVTTYEALVALFEAGVLDFSRVRTFNLDEYVGIPQSHAESYHTYMWKHLFAKVGMRPEQVSIPNGNAADMKMECMRYEQEIHQAGGIDLQLLGIGHNGHIAFNEPDSTFSRATHVVGLTDETIEANKRFFASANEVPRQAVSMGVGTIMRARGILLVASGAAKAPAIRKSFRGEVTPEVPASILQFHPDCTVVLDEAAASEM